MTSSQTSQGRFRDRVDAGRQLAGGLCGLRSPDVVVLGLPGGGVPVASEVADALGARLDILVVRKLTRECDPELALGAVAEEGIEVLNRRLIASLGIASEDVRAAEVRGRSALEARVRRLRRGRERTDLRGRVAVIVDDGMATAATARVACTLASYLGAARVVLAVPVAPADAAVPEADEVVCLRRFDPFGAVGRHYREFPPVLDEEVVTLLDRARRARRSAE